LEDIGDNPADIVLFPPEDDDQTDEDSDCEDDFLAKDPNHLGKGILAQEAELVIHSPDEEMPDVSTVSVTGDIVAVDSDDEQPGPSTRLASRPTSRPARAKRPSREDSEQPGPSSRPVSTPRAKRVRHIVEEEEEEEGEREETEEDDQLKFARTKNSDRRWRNTMPKIFGMSVPDFDDFHKKYVPESCKVPYDFFKLFLDDEFLDLMVTKSQSYAASKNRPDVVGKINRDSLRITQAIMQISGYLTPSQRLMFWEMREDTSNIMVRTAMSRNDFKAIVAHIHFADEEERNAADRFWKVRPLFVHINNKAQELVTQTREVSIDEGMIKYFGPHPLKQRIVGKPIRMGYKVWILATSSGQLLSCQPYAGAATHLKDFGLGQGPNVVMALSLDYMLLPGSKVFFKNSYN